MAYTIEYFDFVNEVIDLEYNTTENLAMFELGNQRIMDVRGRVSGDSTAKNYFTQKGMQHTSVDLNGKDGALPLDLTQPELFYEFYGKFDIATNLGTSEHVEPAAKQYECFSIIHDVVKPGGIMIHLLPNARELKISGAWTNHCHIYYTDEFFNTLASECNYTILEHKRLFGMNAVAFRKETARAFTTNRDIVKLLYTC